MPESIDQLVNIAAAYAGPLFELAQRNGVSDVVRSDLEGLRDLARKDPMFADFIASKSIANEHRAASLERLFRGRLHDLTLNTMLVMNDNDRGAVVPALLDAFVSRQQAAANEIAATAISAFELDGAQKQDIEQTAATLSGKRPVLHWRVDPTIMGGLILEIDGVRYDYSVRRQLLQTRRRLADRGQRGLEVRVEN